MPGRHPNGKEDVVLRRSLPLAVSVFLSLSALAPAEEPLALEKKVLSLAAARKIIAASEAEAKARGLGVVIVVVDDAGNIIQLSRMDQAQVASVNVGIGKARTAAIYRRPSRDSRSRSKTAASPPWTFGPSARPAVSPITPKIRPTPFPSLRNE